MRSIATTAITLVIVAGLLVAGVVGYAERRISGPGPLDAETVFVVPRGAALDRIAEALERNGIISSAMLFRIAARHSDDGRQVRFGEYAIPPGASIRDVLEQLRSGRVLQHALTVPEGLTSWEVVELVRSNEMLTGEIGEIPPEGMLAPDTFMITRGDTRAGLVARMRALQEQRIAQAWEARHDNLAIATVEEALILASLIEKETALADERTRVSAVFHNRLRRGMRLQTDPTIIYGITRGRARFERPIRRSDIDTPTPWNTYTIDGLPPTPIANPGFAALLAAVQPLESRDLFFVADGTGGHAFAETLQQHNRNVAAWRAIERERGLR